jgi:integrase
MKEVFDVLRQFSGDSKYVFQPMKDSRLPHLDPSAINNYLRNLGCKDKLRAHGWRSTALTTGIDVLKCESDVIRKQMGHLPRGKLSQAYDVSQAYDSSTRLYERRVFMEKWCQLLVVSGLKV